MKMNKKMAELLRQADIPVPFGDNVRSKDFPPPVFVLVDNSVFLKEEYERARHVRLADFPDRTGLECFVNHLHLPFSGTRKSLLACIGHASALLRGLARLEDRRFQVIVSITEGECTVRFHELRSNERWIADDLEGYASESILLLVSGDQDDL
jgi:hypothetical protein